MKTFSILSIIFALGSFTIFKGQRMTKIELFFGLSKCGGEIISTKDWQAFADTVIAKTFTDGSTIVDARGQYLEKDGKLISESSKMLIVISKLDAKCSKQIDIVREKYKKYFQQESVMRMNKRVRVDFRIL